MSKVTLDITQIDSLIDFHKSGIATYAAIMGCTSLVLEEMTISALEELKRRLLLEPVTQ